MNAKQAAERILKMDHPYFNSDTHSTPQKANKAMQEEMKALAPQIATALLRAIELLKKHAHREWVGILENAHMAQHEDVVDFLKEVEKE